MKNVKYSSELAEIVGLSFGDGSLTLHRRTLRYQLRGNVTEDKDHYNQYLFSLFNTYVALPLAQRKVSVVQAKAPWASYGFSIESNCVGIFLNSIGVPIGRKEELIIPDWIKADKVFLANFLRGFFDTDGSLYCGKNYSIKKGRKHNQIKIKLTTISKILAYKIKELLRNSLQIKCILWTSKGRSNRKTAYNILISGGIMVPKWFQIIGSKNPKHITKYLIWGQYGFIPPHTCLEQRKAILAGKLDIKAIYAGVTEPGQMC